MLDALNRSNLSTETTPKELMALITSSRGKPRITFFDDDLSLEGMNHNRPLYVTMKYQGNLIPACLIDNGSTLNMCVHSELWSSWG